MRSSQGRLTKWKRASALKMVVVHLSLDSTVLELNLNLEKTEVLLVRKSVVQVAVLEGIAFPF